MKLTRRNFLAITGLAALTSGCPKFPGFPIRDPNVKTDVLEIDYRNRKMKVGIWYNPDFSGERPLIVSSHGFGASTIDLGTANNSLANKGYVILAPDHEDVSRLMSLNLLKSYSGSQEFQEVVGQFGSIDNYVRTLVFPPYLNLKAEEKIITEINFDVLTNLLFNTFNQIRTIPEYRDYQTMDMIDLINSNFVADVDDVRVSDIFGEAFHDSRIKDFSNLIDYSTEDNRMGNNPNHRNVLDEEFKGAVKIDASKIGGIGYSLGGGTMLEILGAGDPCNGKIYHDPRIGPIAILGPPCGMNHKENFPEIKNSVLFLDGDSDHFIKGIARRQPLLGGIGEVVIYENTGHITFSDTSCSDFIYSIIQMIPQVIEEGGNCDSHELVVPSRDELFGMFFDREFGLKSGKQTALIDYALATPIVRYATSDPIIKEEFEAEFPEYSGQI